MFNRTSRGFTETEITLRRKQDVADDQSAEPSDRLNTADWSKLSVNGNKWDNGPAGAMRHFITMLTLWREDTAWCQARKLTLTSLFGLKMCLLKEINVRDLAWLRAAEPARIISVLREDEEEAWVNTWVFAEDKRKHQITFQKDLHLIKIKHTSHQMLLHAYKCKHGPTRHWQ